jgi:hypothetical protein
MLVPLLRSTNGAAWQGRTAATGKLRQRMNKGNYVAASFPLLGYATGAIDWFRNQAIDANAIAVAAVAPDGRLRAPQRGDNERNDLQWIVALDLSKARIPRAVALATFAREGGKPLASVPDMPT